MSVSGKETPDQAKTRRRWITLAELVAVAGVLIAALTLYLNFADRRADLADKAKDAVAAARAQSRIDLTGSVERGNIIVLKDARHDITDTTIVLPKALRIPAQHPVEAEIDGGWFEKPLLKMTDGGADERSGRLPVLVTVRYWDGDDAKRATGIYDVIWRTQGHMLRGRSLSLEGLKLRSRGGDPAALERAWAETKPR